MSTSNVLENLLKVLVFVGICALCNALLEHYTTARTLTTCTMTLKLEYGTASKVSSQTEDTVVYEDYVCRITDQSTIVEMYSVSDGIKQYFANHRRL